ncbi:MAG: NADH-quinone oxidoreductase subunit L [Leptolinea sp.]|jgi:NADH-quinone oxidoreductase subunit L|nr:NADH-quinone oxidoreductase subunit L [Leptolinea sp.]
MTLETLIWLIPVPPIAAFALIMLGANRSRGLSHTLAVTAAGLSWLGSMFVFWKAVHISDLAMNIIASSINWLPAGVGWFKIGVQIDPLSAVTLFFVAWTILCIFIYSIGYHNYGSPAGVHDKPGLPPHGALITSREDRVIHVPSIEPMYSRFFGLISLFAFAMYVLVISDNLLTLYVGWEIMGLCSYLLIGFWYARPTARDAAVKAFLTTRVGDVFMLLGLAALYTSTGSLSYSVIFDPTVVSQLATIPTGVFGLSLAGLAGLLLFIGTIGKSAQFPLHIWLPDAMEGPTPVSAMIHAATMVSAGVYLAARAFPLISAGWVPGSPLTTPMAIMAFVGTFTALFAATIAVVQNDIKRVLAYSTISQLGFMVAALGLGSYIGAVFHLVTHAFFKALLFLGSGSVIHGMEHGALAEDDPVDIQDMTHMGGLKTKMPLTFWTFIAGGLALAGFPLITAGFWSKDEILSGAYNGQFWLIFSILAFTALITAFYTARQITLTFLGQARSTAAGHARESSVVMTLPLVVLALFAIAAGWSGIPAGFPGIGGKDAGWFLTFLSGTTPLATHTAESHSQIPLILSLVISPVGLLAGWLVYRKYQAAAVDPLEKALGPVYSLLKNKYYVDELYSMLFIRPAVWLAERFTAVWMDGKIIDGIVHGVAALTPAFGSLLRNGFDKPVISNGGDGLGHRLIAWGQDLRRFQSGRVQQYMLYTLWIVLISGMIVYYLLGRG